MPLARAGRFYSFFSKFQPLILIACLLIYIVSLIVLPSQGHRLLPPKYGPSLGVIILLLPGALSGLATFPVVMGFIMFIRPKFLFAMDCVSLPVLLLLYHYAIGLYGVTGAAVVTTTANLVRASIAQIMAWKWARGLDSTGIPANLHLSDSLDFAAEVGN
jgi:hypothetical protein